MVEILTLFLGLTTGVHAIELNVAGPVAAVEIRLDGRTVTTLTGAPWVVDCDLGATPLPHDLVAIARDAGGEELDRAEQWINMASRRAASTVALSTDTEGQARALHVDWQSIGEPEPEQIEATFDGQPLDVTDPDHIPLPTHDGGAFHYVGTTVEFSRGQGSQRETEFGGARTDKISTQLTAIVLTLERRSSLPPLDKMRSWFLKDGEPLEIHGVEKGAMDLFVVRGPGSQAAFDELARTVLESSYMPSHGPPGVWRDWDPEQLFAGELEAVEKRLRSYRYRLGSLQQFALLDPKVQLRFVSPRPGPLTPRGIQPEMFARSRIYPGSEGGLSWLARQQPPMSFAPQIAEAVAIAGLLARDGNRRRAVLLISATAASDLSEYSPVDIRELLRALQVPLYVWSLTPSDLGWGEAIELGDLEKPKQAIGRLARAVAALQRGLRAQRVVWLKGRHLPQRIELSAEARGIRLAGS